MRHSRPDDRRLSSRLHCREDDWRYGSSSSRATAPCAPAPRALAASPALSTWVACAWASASGNALNFSALVAGQTSAFGRRLENGFASRRQIRKHHRLRRLGWWWWLGDLRSQPLLGEPGVKLLAAASIFALHCLLRLTIRRTGRAKQPHVNVVMMPIPRPYLGHPGMRFFRFDSAQFLLDRGIDEHALNLGLLSGGLDERDVLRRPGLRVEALPVVGHEIDGRDGVTLFPGQHAVRHRHEPDIDVEAGLMTSVVARRRSAARLRQVADQDTFPASRLGGSRREFFHELDQAGMAPIAITRQAHHLPGRSVDRQFDARG